MANEMMDRSNLFGDMDDWFGFPKNFFKQNSDLMKTDLAENEKNYTLKIDLPGVKKENINLNYQNGILSITATRKSFNSADSGDLIRRERQSGMESRNFNLPNVVANQIHAKYDDGVLTVTLPKQTAGENSSSIQID